ncbi:hypothetical protein [Micrococcoides hystricis]|uniref:Uncharacterized protein n=1 Tax=Micrococcoides hystricis TaxID=1572761 RepID=A0ABV6PAT4_9MICC
MTRSVPTERPTLKLTLVGYVIAWLVPTIIMAAIVFALSVIPGLRIAEVVLSLLPIIAISSLAIGLPGTLLVNWIFRHQLNQWVHVFGYAIVGMLYGLTVLFSAIGGSVPLLIPYIGFPAGILLALGRIMAFRFTVVEDPSAESAEQPTDEQDSAVQDADVHDPDTATTN